MQISECEDNGGEIEASDVRCKPLSAPEVSEEFASGNVGQEHVNVEAVLEGGIEIDDEGVPHAGHDVAFRVNVLHLSESDDLRLAKDLESETVDGPRLMGGGTESNEQYTPKRAGTCGWWIGAVRTKTRERSRRKGGRDGGRSWTYRGFP